MQKARISLVLPILMAIAVAGASLGAMHSQNAAAHTSTRNNREKSRLFRPTRDK